MSQIPVYSKNSKTPRIKLDLPFNRLNTKFDEIIPESDDDSWSENN